MGPFPLQIMTDHKQLEDVEYFNYLRSMITKDGRCTREIKFWISTTKVPLKKNKTFFSNKLDLPVRSKLFTSYVWSIALYGG
jgi:hypothetical protein